MIGLGGKSSTITFWYINIVIDTGALRVIAWITGLITDNYMSGWERTKGTTLKKKLLL